MDFDLSQLDNLSDKSPRHLRSQKPQPKFLAKPHVKPTANLVKAPENPIASKQADQAVCAEQEPTKAPPATLPKPYPGRAPLTRIPAAQSQPGTVTDQETKNVHPSAARQATPARPRASTSADILAQRPLVALPRPVQAAKPAAEIPKSKLQSVVKITVEQLASPVATKRGRPRKAPPKPSDVGDGRPFEGVASPRTKKSQKPKVVTPPGRKREREEGSQALVLSNAVLRRTRRRGAQVHWTLDEEELAAKADTWEDRSIEEGESEEEIDSEIDDELPSTSTGASRRRNRATSRSTKRAGSLKKTAGRQPGQQVKKPSLADKELDPENWSLKDIIRWGSARERRLAKIEQEKEKERQEIALLLEGGEAVDAGGSGEGAQNAPSTQGNADQTTLTRALTVRRPVENTAAAGPARTVGLTPQVEVVEGRLVVNRQSLTVNAQEKEEFTRVVTEDAGSRLNSMTYMNRISNERWSAEDTELFFKAVSQFGTDFTLITHLFPGRHRRHLKNKFTRESKTNPVRMDEALRASAHTTINSYKEMLAMLKESGLNVGGGQEVQPATAALGEDGEPTPGEDAAGDASLPIQVSALQGNREINGVQAISNELQPAVSPGRTTRVRAATKVHGSEGPSC